MAEPPAKTSESLPDFGADPSEPTVSYLAALWGSSAPSISTTASSAPTINGTVPLSTTTTSAPLSPTASCALPRSNVVCVTPVRPSDYFGTSTARRSTRQAMADYLRARGELYYQLRQTGINTQMCDTVIMGMGVLADESTASDPTTSARAVCGSVMDALTPIDTRTRQFRRVKLWQGEGSAMFYDAKGRWPVIECHCDDTREGVVQFIVREGVATRGVPPASAVDEQMSDSSDSQAIESDS